MVSLEWHLFTSFAVVAIKSHTHSNITMDGFHLSMIHTYLSFSSWKFSLLPKIAIFQSMISFLSLFLCFPLSGFHFGDEIFHINFRNFNKKSIFLLLPSCQLELFFAFDVRVKNLHSTFLFDSNRLYFALNKNKTDFEITKKLKRMKTISQLLDFIIFK